MRERDHRNGVAALLGDSLLAKAPYLPELLAHPRWLAAFLADGGVPKLENIVIPGEGPMKLVDVGKALANATVTWEDLRWIRAVWPGPIVVKGVLTGDDGRRAVDAGAAALIVSNHGGRQLDMVSATARALPEVLEAVDGRIEVLMDGGVRRGSDIVKAICLGARAVLVGRAYAYGLAAGGYEGVVRALQILRADVDRTLRLLGCPSIAALDRSYLGRSDRHMIEPGEIISYMEMCQEEGASLQRGMNFRLRGDIGVVLMSLRPGAPYADRVEDDGKTLIYEGHDAPRTPECPDPKKVDQPERSRTGTATQNGLFWEAALAHKIQQRTAAHSGSTRKSRWGFGLTQACSS